MLPACSLIDNLSKLLAHLFCSSHFRPCFSSVSNGFLSFGWLLLNGFLGFVACVVSTPSLSLPLSRRTQAGFQLHPPASTAPSSAGITGVHPHTPLFLFCVGLNCEPCGLSLWKWVFWTLGEGQVGITYTPVFCHFVILFLSFLSHIPPSLLPAFPSVSLSFLV